MDTKTTYAGTVTVWETDLNSVRIRLLYVYNVLQNYRWSQSSDIGVDNGALQDRY